MALGQFLLLFALQRKRSFKPQGKPVKLTEVCSKQVISHYLNSTQCHYHQYMLFIVLTTHISAKSRSYDYGYQPSFPFDMPSERLSSLRSQPAVSINNSGIPVSLDSFTLGRSLQLVDQSMKQSNQPVRQSISQSDSQSVNQSIIPQSDKMFIQFIKQCLPRQQTISITTNKLHASYIYFN